MVGQRDEAGRRILSQSKSMETETNQMYAGMKYMKFRFEFPSVVPFSQRCVALILGTLVTGLGAIPVLADETTKNTTPSKYELKPEHGPWLVFAMSFDGYDAKNNAEQLAMELKRDFKLQAYCMAKKLDYTQSVLGAGIDPNGNNRRLKYRNKTIVDGYAVLVGDFDSVDSPAMTDALAIIKKITPKSLATEGADLKDFDKNSTVPVNVWRDFMRKKNGGAEKFGPMSSAFTTRNPMLPEDFYKTPEVDKFVKKLNEKKEHAEFNLLSCPGKFTVRVAVFCGEDRGVGGWGGANGQQANVNNAVSQLEIAAERAGLATKALRLAGYPAFQFHDRTQSIVTIGSFNELGKADQRNRFVYDQSIQDIALRFGATSQVTRTQQFGVTQTPRILFDLVSQKQIPELNEGDEKSRLKWFTKYSIPFDVRPTPMAVPKPAASSIYSGSLLGKDHR